MDRPNIVFVMADDHAAHALSCYGSERNTTPQLDRLAVEGMRFDRCCCANSICSPSRATILTGTHSHINGVTTLDTPFDARQETFPALLRDAGYQTAIVGRWHWATAASTIPCWADRHLTLECTRRSLAGSPRLWLSRAAGSR